MTGPSPRTALSISFWVPGKPIAQPRPRATIRGAHAGVYNPPTADAWKKEVQFRARGVMLGKSPTSAPLIAELVFEMPGVSKLYTKSAFSAEGRKHLWNGALYHTQKPDCDNLEKAVLDALTGIVYDDDAQIFCASSTRKWCDHNIDEDLPGCRVTIRTP